MPGFFTPQAMGQQTSAVQALFGAGRNGTKRKRRSTRAAAPKRRKKRVVAAGKKLVKGSAAAKAWGAKMKRLRKRK